MSLITRCPACRTMFKVVPDQLKISEGWVRCGKCDEIFDARANLQEAGMSVAPAASAEPAPAFDGVLASAMASAPAPLSTEKGATRIAVDLHETPGRREPQLDAADTLLDASAYGVAETQPLITVEDVEPVPQVEPTVAAAPAASVAPALSFMRPVRAPSRWHRPLVRATLLVASLMLVLGLVLQMLVQERDRVAAVEPGLRPLLEEICLHMGCLVQPLRQIESVVIDSSAFSKIKGDLYRLSLTLKNNAPTDLAMPAIELALTDTLDHALIRRVLQPEDLGVQDGVIRAASETQTTLMLTVKTNGNGERVAGYRLLAFYP